MKKACTVIGAGFQGLISAYLLSQKGYAVTLIEKAPVLGGIMYSWEWNGFYVDKGVHLFDSIPKNLAEIITDVMDGKVVSINFNYASVYNGVTTSGLAIPDFSYHRLRLLSDDMSLELKKHPVLDARLAAMRRVLGKVDDFVSIYPSVGGMRGFCESIQQRLLKMGVLLRTETSVVEIKVEGKKAKLRLENGENLISDHVFWAQDHASLAKVWLNEASYGSLVHAAPMVLYYFALDSKYVCDYTYFHQFTPGSLVFRSSAAGIYSQQIKENGLTYISAECPTLIGSSLWESPDQYVDGVWNECLSMGLLRKDAVRGKEYKVMRAPVTHKYNKVGYAAICDEIDHKIEKTDGVVVKPSRKAFTRRELMWAVEECVNRI